MDLPFFICHYKPNEQRRKYLFENFVDSQKNIRWITEYDREEIEPALDKYYSFSKENYFKMIGPQLHILLGSWVGSENPVMSWSQCFAYAENWLKAQGDNWQCALPDFLKTRVLGSGDVSILLKHQKAWEQMVKNGLEHGCVLEDDVILQHDSWERLNDIMRLLPKEWDYVDLAGGARLHVRTESQIADKIYQIQPPRGRTACGYLISRKFCQQILQMNCPIALPIDWQLNYFFVACNAKVFWVEPSIFLHGSELGHYVTHRTDV